MAITLTAKQKQRLDTASNWSSANPTLLSGEIGYESDTGKTKVGDGSTAWSSLAYTAFGGLPKTGGTMTGAILGDDSTSASTPGYAFDGDANTGLLRTGADAVALVTGGTAAVSVDSSQNVVLAANLTVNGTTTTIDTQNLDVEDKNITIGKVSTPSDTTADGGGITLKGASDKTITWTDSTDSWDFNQHVNIATGTEFKINNASVLSATALGATVVGSSLTSVGTIASGTWQGTAIGSSYMTAGTTSAVGAVQLEDSTTSTSTTKAATPASVKVAKDAADAAATTANAALPKAGGDMTGNIVLDNDKELRFNEADSNGSAYVGVKGASDKSSEASYTISLPAAAPAVNQVLKAGSSTATDMVWATDAQGVTSVTGTAPIGSSGGSTPAISISAATGSAAGSMSSADYSKLSNIETAADVTDATNVAAAGAVMESEIDAKGDLLAGTADNTIARLGVGTDGQVLKADSSTASGLVWSADNATDSTKMPLAGGSFTGDVVFDNATHAGFDLTWDMSDKALEFDDNVKATFGDGGDFSIYHDGADNVLLSNGASCDLLVYVANGELALKAVANGATELYYDNVLTCQTITDGIRVEGTEGASAKLELFADEGDEDADKWRLQAGTGGDWTLDNYNTGSWQSELTVTNAGNLTALGNVTAYSDKRLKTDIKTIDNAVDIVNNLRGVTYTRKDTNEKGIGVIAQEIEDVLPQVVQDGEYKSVAYGNIVGVLIEAVKELKAEIEELKGG